LVLPIIPDVSDIFKDKMAGDFNCGVDTWFEEVFNLSKAYS